MSENKIREAFEQVEPENGARERMYQNILKKAAAEQAVAGRQNVSIGNGTEAKEKVLTSRKRNMVVRWGSLAACAAICILAGVGISQYLKPGTSENPSFGDLAYEQPNTSEDVDDPPVLGASPIEDVEDAQAFQTLGIEMTIPQDASDVSYYLVNGQIARACFTWNGNDYTCDAAALEEDFSGVIGTVESSSPIEGADDAQLEQLSGNIWKAYWSEDNIWYYLCNFDGATEENITELAVLLIE